MPLRIEPTPRRWIAARAIGRDVALIMLGTALVMIGVLLGLVLAERTAWVSPASGPATAHTVPVLPPTRP